MTQQLAACRAFPVFEISPPGYAQLPQAVSPTPWGPTAQLLGRENQKTHWPAGPSQHSLLCVFGQQIQQFHYLLYPAV